MMALPSLRWPNALRFSPVPLDPLETVLFYGPTPRLVRLPLSILRVHLSADARYTTEVGLTRWYVAGASAGFGFVLIALSLFLVSPTAGLLLGVLFGPMLGGPVGWWIGPYFYPPALWVVRKDHNDAWTPVSVDMEWPVRWTAYFAALRVAVGEAAEARSAEAQSKGHEAGVSDSVDRFIRQSGEKPTARFDASSMFELENMDDERADYRSGSHGLSAFVAGGIIGLVALVVLSTMLFAIMMTE